MSKIPETHYEVTPEGIVEKEKLKRPPMYNVVFHNDNFTPMDFVVVVLTTFFGHSTEAAAQIMIDVHKKGKGVAGTYTRDIAEAKIAQDIQNAQNNEHPLLIDIEPTE